MKNTISTSEMDFHILKRKELQALCKKHSIPANLTNLEMANRLTSLLKVNEKPKTQGRSCMKSLDEVVVIVDSDTENKPHKKVKFSPDNELFEYTEIDPRGKRRMSRRNPRSRDVGQNEEPPSKSADGFQLNKEVVNKPVRVTRSRTHSSIEDLNTTTNPPLEMKRGRKTRRQITEGDEVVESGIVSVQGAAANIEGYELNENIVKNPVRVTRARARTSLNNGLDSATNHPVEKKRVRKPRKKIVESDEVEESSIVLNKNLTDEVGEISLVPNQTPSENVESLEPIDDIVKNPVRVTRAMAQIANDELDSTMNPPVERKKGRKLREVIVESDEVKLPPRRLLRTRDVVQKGAGSIQNHVDKRGRKRGIDKRNEPQSSDQEGKQPVNSELLGGETGKVETNGGQRATRLRKGIKTANANSKISTEIKVQREAEVVVVQVKEPLRRTSRNNDRRKSVISVGVNEDKKDDEMDYSVLISDSKYLNLESNSNYPLQSQDETVQGEDDSVGLVNTEGAPDDSLETSLFDCGNKEKGSNMISQDRENDHGQESIEDGAVQEHTEKSHVVMVEAVAELCTENDPAPNPEAVLEHQSCISVDLGLSSIDRSISQSSLHIDETEQESTRHSNDEERLNQHQSPELVCENESNGEENVQIATTCEKTNDGFTVIEQGGHESIEVVKIDQGFELNNPEGAFDDSIENCVFDSANEESSELISRETENDHTQESIEDGFGLECADISPSKPTAVLEHQACVSDNLGLSSVDGIFSQTSLKCIDETGQVSTGQLNAEESFNNQKSPETVYEDESKHEENVQTSPTCEENTNEGTTEIEQEGHGLVEVVEIDQDLKLNSPEGASHDTIQTSVVEYANDEKDSNLISQEGENGHSQESTEDCADCTEISHVIMAEVVAGFCTENEPTPKPQALLENQGSLGLINIDGISSQSFFKCIDETEQVCMRQFNEEERFNQECQEMVCKGESKCNGNPQISTACEENTNAGSTEILQELELNLMFATPLGRENSQKEEDIYSHARMTDVAMTSVDTTSENAGVISEHVECQVVDKSNELERCMEDKLKSLCATPVSSDHRSVSFGQLETREMMNGEETCNGRSNEATVSICLGISSELNIPLKSRDETEKGEHEFIKVATVNHSYKLNTPEGASDNSKETRVSDSGSKLISQEGQNDHGQKSTKDGTMEEHTETSHVIKENVVAGLCIENEHTPKPDAVLEHQVCDSGKLGLSSINGIFSQTSFKYIDENEQVSTKQLNEENRFNQELSQEMGCDDENKCEGNVHISTTSEENTNEGSTDTEQESELKFLFSTPLSIENPEKEREIFSHANITGVAVSVDGAASENVLGIFDNVEHQADEKPMSNEHEKWNGNAYCTDLPFADAIGKDKDVSIFRNEIVGDESKETVKDESRIEEPNEPSGDEEISIAPVDTIDASHSTTRNSNDLVSNVGEFSIQSHMFSSWEENLFAERGEVHETEKSEIVISPILSEVNELREEQLLTEDSKRSDHIDEALEESKVECEEEKLLSSKNCEEWNVAIVDQFDASHVLAVQDDQHMLAKQVTSPSLCGNGEGDVDERSIDGEMNDVGSNERWHDQLKNLFATPICNDHGSVSFGQSITRDIMRCEESYYRESNENCHADEKEPSKCNGALSVDGEEDSRNVPDNNSSEFQGVIDLPFVNAVGKDKDGLAYESEIVGDENRIKELNEPSGDNEISIIPDGTVEAAQATPKNSYDLVSNAGEDWNEALEQSNVEIEEEKSLSDKKCEECNKTDAVWKDKDGSNYRNGFVGDELKEVVKDENRTEPNEPLGENKILITPDGTVEAAQATFNDFFSNAGELSTVSHVFSSWEVSLFDEQSEVHEDGKSEAAISPIKSDVNELKEEQLLTEVSRRNDDINEALEQSKLENDEEKALSSKNGEEWNEVIVNRSDASLDLDVQGNVQGTDLPFAEVVESEKDGLLYTTDSVEDKISMTLDGNVEEALGATHNSADLLTSAGEFNEFSSLEVEKSNVEASTNITQLCEEELLTVLETKDDKPNQDQSVSHLAFQGETDEDVQSGGPVQNENTSGKAEEAMSPYSKKFYSTTMKAKTKRANLVRGTPNKLFLEDMKENAQSFKREPRTDAKLLTKRRALGQL